MVATFFPMKDIFILKITEITYPIEELPLFPFICILAILIKGKICKINRRSIIIVPVVHSTH